MRILLEVMFVTIGRFENSTVLVTTLRVLDASFVRPLFFAVMTLPSSVSIPMSSLVGVLSVETAIVPVKVLQLASKEASAAFRIVVVALLHSVRKNQTDV